MKSYFQSAVEQCSSAELDRLTAAEICLDECLTIMDRHGVPISASIYDMVKRASWQLHEAQMKAKGPADRHDRLNRVRASLTKAFPLSDAALMANVRVQTEG